jgi:hypothetical protein
MRTNGIDTVFTRQLCPIDGAKVVDSHHNTPHRKERLLCPAKHCGENDKRNSRKRRQTKQTVHNFFLSKKD